MTPGLVITPQGCQATTFGHDAVTVQCPFTLANNGAQTLVIGVVAVDSTGAPLSIQPVQLVPGATPVQIPAPPTGATWLVAAETQGQINAEQDWSFLFYMALGGLAGWTIGEIAAWAMRKAGWWS